MSHVVWWRSYIPTNVWQKSFFLLISVNSHNKWAKAMNRYFTKEHGAKKHTKTCSKSSVLGGNAGEMYYEIPALFEFQLLQTATTRGSLMSLHFFMHLVNRLPRHWIHLWIPLVTLTVSNCSAVVASRHPGVTCSSPPTLFPHHMFRDQGCSSNSPFADNNCAGGERSQSSFVCPLHSYCCHTCSTLTRDVWMFPPPSNCLGYQLGILQLSSIRTLPGDSPGPTG